MLGGSREKTLRERIRQSLTLHFVDPLIQSLFNNNINQLPNLFNFLRIDSFEAVEIRSVNKIPLR
jgi:hypothetical protein